jgi:hypothetical protein
MKISNSSVFISGIDDVEKVFSYSHPAVKQMDYQVEVPELALSCPSCLVIYRPKAATGKIHFHCRKAEGGHGQLTTLLSHSGFPIADAQKQTARVV